MAVGKPSKSGTSRSLSPFRWRGQFLREHLRPIFKENGHKKTDLTKTAIEQYGKLKSDYSHILNKIEYFKRQEAISGLGKSEKSEKKDTEDALQKLLAEAKEQETLIENLLIQSGAPVVDIIKTINRPLAQSTKKNDAFKEAETMPEAISQLRDVMSKNQILRIKPHIK